MSTSNQGHSYTATVTLDDGSAVYGNTSVLFDPFQINLTAVVLPISLLNTRNYNKYNLLIGITTNPPLHSLAQYTSTPLQVSTTFSKTARDNLIFMIYRPYGHSPFSTNFYLK